MRKRAKDDWPDQRRRLSEAGRGEQDRLEMYGGIGDILRDYGRRRQIDGVNNRGVGVRREIVWLRKCGAVRNDSPESLQMVADGIRW